MNTCNQGHPGCPYQHPEWWNPALEHDACRAERKAHLTRCRTCGIVMRCDDEVCGDVPGAVPGECHRQ